MRAARDKTKIEEYGGQLMECAEDRGSCLYTLFCYPCAFGTNQAFLGGSCPVYSLVACCCPPIVLLGLHATRRDDLEELLGGQKKGCFGQCCPTTCLCTACATCQETRAIKRVAVDDAGTPDN